MPVPLEELEGLPLFQDVTARMAARRPRPMKTPTATYRLQFRGDMDFAAAVEIVPYLKQLGVSHLYASPIFTATSGSTHGYDVTDAQRDRPRAGRARRL